MMKKNFLLWTMMFSIVFLFSGCGFPKGGNSQNKINYYNDDKAISTSEEAGNKYVSSRKMDNNKNIIYKADRVDGFAMLGEASVQSDTETTIHFSITANVGKAKLVLVRPDSKVEVLKEVIADKGGSYDGDVTFSCPKGVCKLKIVGDNYSGDCKISQTNVIFTLKWDSLDNK